MGFYSLPCFNVGTVSAKNYVQCLLLIAFLSVLDVKFGELVKVERMK